MRDDFTEDVKRNLAARVGYLCSNPDCRAQTTGPQNDPAKAVNVGVAAHITAASAGGPRYNPALSQDERRDPANGIWLCQNCAKQVDNDVLRFQHALLRAWKTVAENRARNSLGKTASRPAVTDEPALELELSFEPDGIVPCGLSPRELARGFVLGLNNVGAGTVRFPSIRYKRASGLIVNDFGIDGNYGFGLPQSPSDNEWVSFRGGMDHVIHRKETLKIAKLFQRGDNRSINGISAAAYPNLFGPNGPTHARWVFKATTFQCEISAEGILVTAIERSIPEEETIQRLF
jgi:hypothetical protein